MSRSSPSSTPILIRPWSRETWSRGITPQVGAMRVRLAEPITQDTLAARLKNKSRAHALPEVDLASKTAKGKPKGHTTVRDRARPVGEAGPIGSKSHVVPAVVGIVDSRTVRAPLPTARPDLERVDERAFKSSEMVRPDTTRTWTAGSKSMPHVTPRAFQRDSQESVQDATPTGRWRSSQGRLLTLDENGPHNRAHDRRHSFPHPPPTADARVQTSSFSERKSRFRPRASAFSNADCQRLSQSPNVDNEVSGHRSVGNYTPDSEANAQESWNTILEDSDTTSRGTALDYSWVDPFSQERRVWLERGRKLRTRESVFGVLGKDGKVLETARNSLYGAYETRKSSQISRTNLRVQEKPLDHVDIFTLTRLVEQADMQGHYAREMKRKASSQGDRDKPHIFYEVPWHLPTKAEVRKKNGADEDVKADHLVAHLGARMEQHLEGAIGPTIEGLRWGDRKVSKELCGLLEVDQALQRGAHLNSEFVGRMDEAVSFLKTMRNPRNKQVVLEGRVHSHATLAEANLFLEKYEDHDEPKTELVNQMEEMEAAYNVDNLSFENLDTMLKNMMLMKDRGAMFYEDRRFGREDAKKDEAESKTEQSSRDTDGRHFLSASEVIQHGAFHRDLVYTKYKTTELKHDMREMEQEVRSIRRHDIRRGVKTDKSIHYLRFNVLSAENLPIMDESKRTNDAYVRCSLYYDDKIIKLSEEETEQTVCTKIAFDTKKPTWHQDFMFTVPFHPSAEVILMLEVLDASHVDVQNRDEIDDEIQIPSDVVLGHVKILVMNSGIQILTPELENRDVYLLKDKNGEDVRDNFGIANAVLKGRNSTLEVDYLYTKKPRRSIDDYVVLLQSNIRIMIARRTVSAYAYMREQQEKRGNLLSEFRIAKDKEFAWTKYQETCKLLGTPPISRLKDQLYSGGITFSRYQINPVGLQAITFVITDLLLSSNMTQISLTHMDINSNGLKILADGLCGVDRCPLLVLVLDGNPLRTEPTDRSQDSGQLQANSNKNSYSNTAALTLAAIVEHIRRLSRLSLEGCQLGNSGIEILAEVVKDHPNLTYVNLSDNEVAGSCGNDMLQASISMGQLLTTNDTLIELCFSKNNLNGKCGQAFLGGAAYLGQGLLGNCSLRTLNVAGTGVCRSKEGVEILAKILSQESCALETLDISYCGLTAQYMATFSDSLNESKVRMLNLDGNLIQTHGDGYRMLMSRRGRKRFILDYSKKAIGSRDRKGVSIKSAAEIQSTFDSYCQMGALNLMKDKGKVKGLLGSLGFNWSEQEVVAAYNSMDADHNGTIDFKEFYAWYLHEIKVAADQKPVIDISLQQCGVIPKDANFDTSCPTGTYEMDMHFLRSRNIFRSLMQMVLSGKGAFVPDSVYQIIIDESGMEQMNPFIINVPGDVSKWIIPRDGWLIFRFESKRLINDSQHEPWVVLSLNDDEMVRITDAFTWHGTTLKERISVLDECLFTKSRVVFKQALKIVKMFPTFTSDSPREQMPALTWSAKGRLELSQRTLACGIPAEWERAVFVTRILPFLNVQQRDLRLLDIVEEWERRAIENTLGIFSQHGVTCNLMGFHRFNLSRLTERDMCIELISIAENELKEAGNLFREFGSRHKDVGGPRDKTDLRWRNARLNGTSLASTQKPNSLDFSLPFHGILHADFVDIRKPNSQAMPMDRSEFSRFMSDLHDQRLNSREKMNRVIELSGRKYFSCLQVVLLQQLFKGDEYGLRAEVTVRLFSRTVDWRAYNYVIQYAGLRERKMILQRLGRLNLFFDGASTAVGYWELDLAQSDDRYIMQELLFQSVSEHPTESTLGDLRNFVDCEYSGSPFDIPMSWVTQRVPRTGQISFFFVRTKEDNEKNLRLGSSDGKGIRGHLPEPRQYPLHFYLPCVPNDFAQDDCIDVPWIMMEKIRLVKETMQGCIDSVQYVFKMMDKDGSASLDRQEFSAGLLQIGILLKPSEMKLMLDALDFDGSGDISLQEFESFWRQAPPLRWNDEEQSLFWNKRGFRGQKYDDLVRLYDIRTHYPLDDVKEYGLTRPGALVL